MLDPVDDVYDNDLPPVLAPGKLLSLILEVPHLLPAGQGNIFINVVGHSNGDPSRSDEENLSRLDMVDDAVIIAFESINKKSISWRRMLFR